MTCKDACRLNGFARLSIGIHDWVPVARHPSWLTPCAVARPWRPEGQRWLLATIAVLLVIWILARPATAQRTSQGPIPPTPSATTKPAATKSGGSGVRPADSRRSTDDSGRTKLRVASQAMAPGATPSPIVAMVNGEKILRDELATECIRRFGEIALEGEVNKRLILAACKDAGIQVTDDEVSAEIKRMADRFGLSIDRYLSMLRNERDISEPKYRHDIVWPMLALKKLATKTQHVAPEELERALESEFGPMVQVRMIACRSREKAEQALAKARANPAQFDRLAKDLSEDENSAATRGLIPPVRRHVGEPTVEQAVFQLKVGEITPILNVADQFLIFRCERHIPPRELTEEQKAQVREDLLVRLQEDKLKAASGEIFQTLQSKAEVVNVFNDAEKKKAMPGVAATVNGQPITMRDLGEQCILRYGKEVLEGEINRKLLNQALKKRSLEVSQADLKLEIGRAAESFGFVDAAGKPDLDRWLENVTKQSGANVDMYVRDVVWPSAALKKLVDSTVEVSQEDLEKGFEANYGPRVEVLAIVLANQRSAHEVFDLARRNPTDKFFGELANQYSVEPVSKANFGQVPPIRRWGGQPTIEQEAFALKPGETSGVIAAGDKFIILRCLGFTKPVVREVSEVQDELERDLREKKMRLAMNSEFDRLREAGQIDNFLDRTMQNGKTPAQPASTNP